MRRSLRELLATGDEAAGSSPEVRLQTLCKADCKDSWRVRSQVIVLAQAVPLRSSRDTLFLSYRECAGHLMLTNYMCLASTYDKFWWVSHDLRHDSLSQPEQHSQMSFSPACLHTATVQHRLLMQRPFRTQESVPKPVSHSDAKTQESPPGCLRTAAPRTPCLTTSTTTTTTSLDLWWCDNRTYSRFPFEVWHNFTTSNHLILCCLNQIPHLPHTASKHVGLRVPAAWPRCHWAAMLSWLSGQGVAKMHVHGQTLSNVTPTVPSLLLFKSSDLRINELLSSTDCHHITGLESDREHKAHWLWAGYLTSHHGNTECTSHGHNTATQSSHRLTATQDSWAHTGSSRHVHTDSSKCSYRLEEIPRKSAHISSMNTENAAVSFGHWMVGVQERTQHCMEPITATSSYSDSSNPDS